jgi:hypothetical protein
VDDLALLDEGMARLADGDRSAIDAVFQTMWPHIVRCCEKMLGPGEEHVAARRPAHVVFVTSAAGLALLTGAMGCSCAGPVGVAGMLVGLLVPVGPVLAREASR